MLGYDLSHWNTDKQFAECLKDADFIICTKNILDTTNEIQSVYIDGKKAV